MTYVVKSYYTVTKQLEQGKSSKEVVEALKDFKDLTACLQSVSVLLSIALQHLTDTLFIQLSNFALLHHDFYLNHVKLATGTNSEMLRSLVPVSSQMLFSMGLNKTLQNKKC